MKKLYNKLMQNKLVYSVIAPVIRGALKVIPGGTTLVEVTQNIMNEGNDKPHTYMSLVVQIFALLAIFYAFYTKSISLDEFLNSINYK